VRDGARDVAGKIGVAGLQIHPIPKSIASFVAFVCSWMRSQEVTALDDDSGKKRPHLLVKHIPESTAGRERVH
jgi:hypothetical protein